MFVGGCIVDDLQDSNDVMHHDIDCWICVTAIRGPGIANVDILDSYQQAKSRDHTQGGA
jgi:hypothetical protein